MHLMRALVHQIRIEKKKETSAPSNNDPPIQRVEKNIYDQFDATTARRRAAAAKERFNIKLECL